MAARACCSETIHASGGRAYDTYMWACWCLCCTCLQDRSKVPGSSSSPWHIHVCHSLVLPPQACPFVVRGPTYLKDRKKVPAGLTAFTFAAMDVITMPHVVEHVARYLPAIR